MTDNSDSMRRLVYITTLPMALRNLCEGQLAQFRESGFEVFAVASPGEDLEFTAKREGVQSVGIPMEREIRPLRDLVSLWRLWRLMRRLRPDAVITATSKASLLGLLAAWGTRVPARVYYLWGLRLETTRGLKRSVLAAVERITAACAQRIICVSESLRQAFVIRGLAKPEKTTVLMHGSCNGIRAEQFAQTPAVREVAARLRRQWGVDPAAPVIGFTGRLVRDKGVVETIDAFEEVLAERPDAWLLLVGNYETGDPVPEEYVRRIAEHPRIIRPGFIRDLAPYYGAMSVFVFPTHRDGFGNVACEASAAELPVVTFRATGAVDAVAEGVSGTLVDVGDAKALAAAIVRYLDDPELRRRHGQAGRERVLRDFRREPIQAGLVAEVQKLLEASQMLD